MNVRIVYIYPANDGQRHTELAMRFVRSYIACPPEAEHESVIVLNGGTKTPAIEKMFSQIQCVRFLERDDSGWDIGGYQDAAAHFPSDMMVFLGGSTYFFGRGWLKRMVEAFELHGPALYGAMGNRGDLYVGVWPHIRTTGFWTTTDLMNRYPKRITRKEDRYEFEHGKGCFTGWVASQGLKIYVVTWDGMYPWKQWDSFPNGMHRGTQQALLVGDRVTDCYRPKRYA